MVFEALHHFSQLVQTSPAANHIGAQVHPHQALNLVGGNDEVFNRYDIAALCINVINHHPSVFKMITVLLVEVLIMVRLRRGPTTMP
jgi:hypothetical protein